MNYWSQLFGRTPVADLIAAVVWYTPWKLMSFLYENADFTLMYLISGPF